MSTLLKKRLLLLCVVTAVFLLLCITTIWQVDYRMALSRQDKTSQHINGVVEHILVAQYANKSEALAKSGAIVRLLRGELSDASLEVSLTLNTARSISGADLLYVLDRNGILIAASSHPKKRQIMGRYHGFRPYFKAGMHGQSMLYAAVGASTGERGAYFSSPVLAPVKKTPIGVAVVKAGLEDVDALFSFHQDIVSLVSPDGVVFASNRPDWLYRSSHPLAKDALDRIYQERQFPREFPLEPLPVHIREGVESVSLAGATYTVSSKNTVIPGWKLLTLSRYEFPFIAAGAATGVILLLVSVIMLYLVSLDKKHKLQHRYDKQTDDLTRTRKDLVTSELLLKSVVEDQSELIIRFNAEQVITFVNSAFCRYYDKKCEEIVGTVFTPVIADGDLEGVNKLLESLNVNGPVGEMEYRVLLPDQGIRWHYATIRKIFDEQGNVAEYQTVSRDVTARKRAEEALKDANTELSQYAYIVSHDLRAPLRAIHNYADFLREDLEATLSGDQKKYLDAMGRVVKEAEVLVEDVLELSRVSRRDIQIEKVEMEAFMRRLIASLDLPQDIEVVVANDWPTIDAEPTLLRQIFQNLITNAVKFNKSPHKRVELGWRVVGGNGHEFFVRDNGIGIDPRYHEQIFRVFERLHSREEFEGTGAGLAIVKKAAARLHGTVRVESEAGKGSTFFVIIPKKQKEKAI